MLLSGLKEEELCWGLGREAGRKLRLESLAWDTLGSQALSPCPVPTRSFMAGVIL